QDDLSGEKSSDVFKLRSHLRPLQKVGQLDRTGHDQRVARDGEHFGQVRYARHLQATRIGLGEYVGEAAPSRRHFSHDQFGNLCTVAFGRGDDLRELVQAPDYFDALHEAVVIEGRIVENSDDVEVVVAVAAAGTDEAFSP